MDTPKDADARKDEEVTSTPPTPDLEKETTETVSLDADNASTENAVSEPSTPVVPEQPTVAASAQPAAPAPQQQPEEKPQNNPMTLVLQWLTYAFWGWFALSIMWLSIVTISFLVVGASSSDWSMLVAYPIAAVVVLFLVAGTVDFFYSRVEPARKQSVATAIMVIHAVIFALCGIGAMIGAVFALISLALNGTSGETGKATLVSLLVALVLLFVYALLIARTVLVAKIRRIALITTGVFGALALLFIILGVTGPVAQSIITRQDREIETALGYVPNAMQSYVKENNKLPATLGELNIEASSSTSSEVEATLGKNLIRYTPNVKEPKKSDAYGTLQSSDGVSLDESIYKTADTTTYYYKLCVTWAAEKGSDYERTVPYPAEDLDSEPSYSSYISTYYHNKGEQCYNMQTEDYTS